MFWTDFFSHPDWSNLLQIPQGLNIGSEATPLSQAGHISLRYKVNNGLRIMNQTFQVFKTWKVFKIPQGFNIGGGKLVRLVIN